MERDFSLSSQEAEEACRGALHPLAVQGLELFNQGEFFEAHEALELAWREETGPVREMYRGILQIGVGYYHILRGNYRGAVKMFLRARGWLAPYPDLCRGVDLGALRRDAARAEEALLRLGPERISSFDRRLMKPVQFRQDESAG